MTEQASASKEETNKMLFMQLIVMLSTTAMQQMGKIVNPGTGKSETDLQGASATIDLLDMLHQKTQGNLDAEEEKLMSDALSSLKMTYVDSSKEEPVETPPETAEEQPTATEEKPLEEPTARLTDEEKKEPRFQKKYD